MPNSKASGTIEYSRRAFHQDAMDAMKHDIVRGIIELVTNSDDAYVQMDNDVVRKIVVEVEHRKSQPWRVIVRDRATGMNAQTLKTVMSKLGGRTSGFEAGADIRGNLGRGAKDCAAFGDVTFKTIRNRSFAQLVLRSTGKWELQEDRKSTKKDRQDMGIPRGNGTVVEIEAMKSIRCPLHDNLKRKLATHYQLRDILSDPHRRVELVKINDGTRDRLIYEYPEAALVVFDEKIMIDGYPEAEANLVINRHDTRYDEGPHDPGRPPGILVKGKRAIYENSLFKFENSVEAGRFSGTIACTFIDLLAREYDNRLESEQVHPANNPMPIISRRRDGLNHEHPFYLALRAAVESPLGALIAEEAERAKTEASVESTQTKADLKILAREIGRLINEELRDIEAEELLDGEGEVPILAIVPEMVFAYIGEDRTLTLAARKDTFNEGDEIIITLDPEGVADLLTPVVPLKPHSRREDLLVGQIRLRPILEGESTLVTATSDYLEANALAEIRPPREIVEEEIEIPDSLMFERPSYRVGWQRTKSIKVIAPASVVADYGDLVRISSSDPGIVVRTQNPKLVYDDTVEFYCANIRVEARVLNATAELRAELNGLLDTAQVKVTRKESGANITIKLEPEKYGSFRAIMETEYKEFDGEVRLIKVAGHHPAIKPFLSDDFRGQESTICKALIAEAVADVAARHVVNKLYQQRRSIEEFDSDRIYREHNKLLFKFLPRIQRLQLGDPKKLLETLPATAG